MRYRVLGPLEVSGTDGRPVDVGGAKPRALLTLLLADVNRVVGIDRIVATLWGDDPPPTVTGTLQAYVSHLRRVLEPERGPREAPTVLLTRAPGYLLRAEAADLDSLRFPELVEEAERAIQAGDAGRGVSLLDQALKLWRGEPLPELGDTPTAATDRLRLVELHVRARERRCDALLALGRADAAVPDLERLVAENPLRERLWARLATALYAAHRQADALEAIRKCTELLRDELGIDPGPELRDLERAVLRQDPKLTERVPRPKLTVAPPPAPAAPVSVEAEEIVGRVAEREKLRAVAEQVGGGRPAIVVLEGEAGIGKTRLAEAVAEYGRASGWAVAWARCADDAGAPPLWPWTQALEQLGQEQLTLVTEAEAGGDADAARFRLFQDLRARLTAAASRPVLVVLDDLQGADTTTVQLLGLLGRHLPRVPLLLVVTARTIGEQVPESVSDALARLAREPAATCLTLSGLGPDDVQTLLARQLGGGDRSLASAVHDRTGGNPFFVVELSRWMLGAHDLQLNRVPVPPSVGEVLRKRLDRLPAGTPDQALLERLAHHFVEAVPVVGTGPALRYSADAAQAARYRWAHGEAAEHTRRALRLLDPNAPDALRTRHSLLTLLGNDLLRSGQRTEAHEVTAQAIAAARELGDRRCLAEAAAIWGSVTVWNWRPHGFVDDDLVAVLEDLLEHRDELADTEGERDRLTARLLGTLGVELAFSSDLQKGVRYADRAVELARTLGDAELLGRTLNNYSLAVWGRPAAAELRLATADETIGLAGKGLPRRTEFFARLHRAAIRLHMTDLRGFEADLDAARRLAISLSGPEVRPHVLWQQAGAAWLRGDAARAEELTTEAYELYRRVTPHARHAYAAHQFTLRRGDSRLPEAIDLLVATGDEGNPLLQLMAVLAAAESGDPKEARRLRARWGRTQIRDWASDVAVLLEAEVALHLGDEPEQEEAVVQLLPFRGRQAVLGTPSFSLGAYDELLGRIAEHHGDTVAAREWWRAARQQGRLVGSPHQVALAESHLERVPEEQAVRPRRKRTTTPSPLPPDPGPAAESA
jgi:DNA-binding SARP family transcriptional activator